MKRKSPTRTLGTPLPPKSEAAGIPGPAKKDDHRATVDRILDGARNVLVKYGYAGFTTRRVADAASIAPGNLSYHFPSKRELLRALIARLVADYSRQFEMFLSDRQIPVGREIASLVQWLLTDAVADETVHTFRELWTMSLRDSVIRRAIDDFYDEVMNRVVQLLHRSCPGADARAIREFVQVLALMSEGSNVLYGTRAARTVTHDRIIAIATQLLKTLAPDLQLDLSNPVISRRPIHRN